MNCIFAILGNFVINNMPHGNPYGRLKALLILTT